MPYYRQKKTFGTTTAGTTFRGGYSRSTRTAYTGTKRPSYWRPQPRLISTHSSSVPTMPATLIQAQVDALLHLLKISVHSNTHLVQPNSTQSVAGLSNTELEQSTQTQLPLTAPVLSPQIPMTSQQGNSCQMSPQEPLQDLSFSRPILVRQQLGMKAGSIPSQVSLTPR